MESRVELARSGLRIVWCLTFALAASAPILRWVTGTRGIENWPVYTCAVLMLLTAFATRKLSNSFFTSILMSVAGIGFGAGLGFLTLALVSGKAIQYLLALKWLTGGAFLQWLYLRQLRRLGVVEPTCDAEGLRQPIEERIAGKSRDEIGAMIEADMAEIERLSGEFNRELIVGGVLVVLGLGLLVSSLFLPR